MHNQQVPPPTAFFEVEFCDLSARGFSFFMEQLPKFDTLVAALGRPPAVAQFTARIKRVARMSYNGHTRYLVGCDFIERVQSSKPRV